MTPRLNLIGLVVANMATSLAFYRLLGLEVPDDADDQPHVEVVLPGGPGSRDRKNASVAKSAL